MRLLLDTHVLIWWLKDAKLIRPDVRGLMAAARTEVVVSSVSAWEIAYKVRLGKLIFDAAFLDDFKESVVGLAFVPLPITHGHAVAGARLDSTHRDPFDRLLAGQAMVEGLTLVSADPAFKALGVETLWQ